MPKPAWRGPAPATRPQPHCETRMDDQSIEFHRKVHDAYHALAAAEPERVKLVNGRAGMDEIEREVWSIVSAHV